MNAIDKIIQVLLEKKISPIIWAATFLSIIFIRDFIEEIIAKTVPDSTFENVVQCIHDAYFFAIAFILLWIIASFFIKINPKKLAYLFLLGSFLIILPPVIDMLRTGGEVFWSFYILSSLSDLPGYFLTFFGNLPTGIVYFGTKIVFLASIVFTALLIFIKTRNFSKTLMGTLAAYAALFFMGIFPTVFYFFYNFISGAQKMSAIRPHNIIQLFGTSQKLFGFDPQALKYIFTYNLNFIFFPVLIILILFLFYLISKEKLKAAVLNIRFPQLVYHGGLLFIGLGLGFLNYPQNFNNNIFSFLAVMNLLLSIGLAWIASVFLNDIYDLEIDKITNPERPLPQNIFDIKTYAGLGILCFILSFVSALSVGFIFAFMILTYQILAWFYSAPPFRLKKFPGIATFTSALASILLVFMGYVLISNMQTIHTLQPRIIFLLIISLTLSLPIKDFKDTAGDKYNGIWTIPVIFGEKTSRTIVATGIFACFVASTFFLNELRLFWWSLFFGTMSFLVITSPKTKPRQLFWRVLGLVFLYGLVLVKIAFL
jgi:4-hydroxybenzoate polyprenyltransferase